MLNSPFKHNFIDQVSGKQIDSGNPDLRKSKIGKRVVSVNPGENIQRAIDEVNVMGGGTVFLASGTHNVTNDIILYSSIRLEGESMLGTIIDFGGGSYTIRAEGTDVYAEGTVAATQGLTTVTGSGTTWTSDMAGQFILIDGDYYEIDSITSETELEMTSGFAGVDISGESYVIATIVIGVSISNLIVQNSSTHLIKIQYASLCILDKFGLYVGDNGLDVRDSTAIVIDANDIAYLNNGIYYSNAWSITQWRTYIYNCTLCGIEQISGGDSLWLDLGVSNNGDVGIKLTNTEKLSLTGFTIDSNVSHGIELVSGCSDNSFNSGSVLLNGGDGIKMTATATRNTLTQIQSINENTGYGVNIADLTSENNLILGNIFYNNTTGQMNDSGAGNLIRSNIGVDDNIGPSTSPSLSPSLSPSKSPSLSPSLSPSVSPS